MAHDIIDLEFSKTKVLENFVSLSFCSKIKSSHFDSQNLILMDTIILQGISIESFMESVRTIVREDLKLHISG